MTNAFTTEYTELHGVIQDCEWIAPMLAFRELRPTLCFTPCNSVYSVVNRFTS
jgi:hypothetical protein